MSDNDWTWWQNALRGVQQKASESHPEQGFYRVRYKGEQWQPVAIWKTVDESVEGKIVYHGKVGDRMVSDVNQLWTSCLKHPIEHAVYLQAMAGGGFDDEPHAGIGHNLGIDDPVEAMRVEIAGEAEQIEEFLKTEVTTQAQADRLAIWGKRLKEIDTRAEAARVEEKEPHLRAGREVDAKWNAIRASASDWYERAKRHIAPFLLQQKALERKRQQDAAAEAARLRREAAEAAEAERKRQELERKAQELEQQAQDSAWQGADPTKPAEAAAGPSAEEQQAQAAALREQARQLEVKDQAERDKLLLQAQEAERAAQPVSISAGRTGSRVGVRTERRATVVDYLKAAKALLNANYEDLKKDIDKYAQRFAKAKMPLDGVEMKDVDKV